MARFGRKVVKVKAVKFTSKNAKANLKPARKDKNA